MEETATARRIDEDVRAQYDLVTFKLIKFRLNFPILRDFGDQKDFTCGFDVRPQVQFGTSDREVSGEWSVFVDGSLPPFT